MVSPDHWRHWTASKTTKTATTTTFTRQFMLCLHKKWSIPPGIRLGIIHDCLRRNVNGNAYADTYGFGGNGVGFVIIKKCVRAVDD